MFSRESIVLAPYHINFFHMIVWVSCLLLKVLASKEALLVPREFDPVGHAACSAEMDESSSGQACLRLIENFALALQVPVKVLKLQMDMRNREFELSGVRDVLIANASVLFKESRVLGVYPNEQSGSEDAPAVILENVFGLARSFPRLAISTLVWERFFGGFKEEALLIFYDFFPALASLKLVKEYCMSQPDFDRAELHQTTHLGLLKNVCDSYSKSEILDTPEAIALIRKVPALPLPLQTGPVWSDVIETSEILYFLNKFPTEIDRLAKSGCVATESYIPCKAALFSFLLNSCSPSLSFSTGDLLQAARQALEGGFDVSVYQGLISSKSFTQKIDSFLREFGQKTTSDSLVESQGIDSSDVFKFVNDNKRIVLKTCFWKNILGCKSEDDFERTFRDLLNDVRDDALINFAFVSVCQDLLLSMKFQSGHDIVDADLLELLRNLCDTHPTTKGELINSFSAEDSATLFIALENGGAALSDALRKIFINIWPNHAYVTSESGPDDEICVICLNKLERSLRRVSSCKHSFHGTCLFRWFLANTEHPCPICRSKLPLPRESIIEFVGEAITPETVTEEVVEEDDELIGERFRNVVEIAFEQFDHSIPDGL